MMKKFILLFPLITVFAIDSDAQYCTISTASSYSLQMPGISNFTLNTIDRTSLGVECGTIGCNNYVNTGESTSLQRGNTYNVSITTTRDAVNFANTRNNIRIWIDYNNNDKLDDADETVVSMDYQTYGVVSASFTVPSTANLGSTRMRVTAKMSDDAGHILPSPCDIPADPIGYHGEMEDYTVNIVLATSVKENSIKEEVSIYPNPAKDVINVRHSFRESIPYQIFDIYGREVNIGRLDQNTSSINVSDLETGQYVLIIQEESGLINRTFQISR